MCLIKKKKIYSLCWKSGFTESWKDRKKDFLSTGSLSKWLQWPELRQSKAGAKGFFWISHTDAGSQGFGPSSALFPGQKEGAELKVEQLEQQLKIHSLLN